MSTELIIEEKEFDSEIYSDFGIICQMIYPGCRLQYEGREENVHKYTINQVVEIDSFKQKAKECREECKRKRKEKESTVQCGVVRIGNEYFIMDGDKKIALFE
jgi:hypothetical protein